MKILGSAKPRVAKAVSRVALSSLRVGTRLFNPLTLALAGSRHLPLIGIEQFVRVRHASATSRLSQK